PSPIAVKPTSTAPAAASWPFLAQTNKTLRGASLPSQLLSMTAGQAWFLPLVSSNEHPAFTPDTLKLMRWLCVSVLFLSLFTDGCHSPYIEATISNRTSEPVQLLEVDYPSASFGAQTLAPGKDFHYRFKVLGEGKMKLTYTDNSNHEHKFEGPTLK